MKKKLLITVGAGASIDFGLPSVSTVDKLFDNCAAESYPLAGNSLSNLYRHCRDVIDTYYGFAKPLLRKWANFEEVLYQLNLMAPYLTDTDWQHGSNALLMTMPLPDVVEPKTGRRKPVDGDMVRQLANSLMVSLVDHFIDACATATKAKAAEITELGCFLTSLQDEFEIGIITLNYDNMFTQAIPGLHTGFNCAGEFDPMSVLSRSKWGFIYHLHGSVHFAMTGATHDMHGITWTNTPEKNHAAYPTGRNAQDSMEGTSYPRAPFVAGYGKTQQILRQPFRTYFTQVNRLVHEADSLLFLGYGFSDLHLNAAFSEVRSRRRPVVVIDWAAPTQDSLPHREDAWVHNLFKTLPGNAHEMAQEGCSAPAYLGDLITAREMEVSRNPAYPLAVWYNGMLEACRHPEKILAHLN
jgi:hypothetical protein